jgi:hypothetical protein
MVPGQGIQDEGIDMDHPQDIDKILNSTEVQTDPEILRMKEYINEGKVNLYDDLRFVSYIRRNKSKIMSLMITTRAAAEANQRQLYQAKEAFHSAMYQLLTEALDYQQESFTEDGEVNGADLLDWFTDWRDRVHSILRRPK